MSSDRPNILFIITDHHAYFDHHRGGEFDFTLPVFERFCSEGVRFARAYAVCPLCSPARASMLSGVYPSSHGLRWNTEAIRLSENLIDFRPEQRLYSHYLREAGYRNAYVGKWHCGHEKIAADYGMEGWSLPDYGKVYMSDAYKAYAAERGLGEARAQVEQSVDRPEFEGKLAMLRHESPWYFMNGSGVLVGPAEAHEEQFVSHLASGKLKELAAAGQPFSLVASYWGPHQPYYPSEPYASMIEAKTIPEYPSFNDDYVGKPLRHFFHRDLTYQGLRKRWPDWATWQEVLARAYGQQIQLDAAIGELLSVLDDAGAAENTLVIWVADHGDALASHGGLWDKASTFTEEVARVPLAIRWPAAFKGGATVKQLVSNMDVTATMLDAAGVAVPEEMHSRSLLALCRDAEDAEWPDHVVCEHNGHGDNILQRMIICGRWKYVAAHLDMDELYDLEADPNEFTNLITSPQHAGVRAMLRAKLIDHIEATGDRLASRRLLYELRKGF